MIPIKKLTYMCMVVNVPTEGDFHMIANIPLVSNREVVCHMALYGCDAKGEERYIRLI